ncbi:MAG TPA: hypothetical protein P5340_10990 [Defluviicoccus sp.]|nr:hypothetical protein [Defluviicoccus sp.]
MAEPVEGKDQSGQVLFGDILEFVEGKDHGRMPLGGSPANGGKKVSKVSFQIATVGDPLVGLEVEADFDVLILDLEGVDKAPQCAQGRSQSSAGSFAAAQAEQGCSQRRGKQARQRSIFRCFDLDRGEATSLGLEANLVQEHSLADAAQPIEDETAGGTPDLDAVEGDACALNNVVTARKLRRRETSAGRVTAR